MDASKLKAILEMLQAKKGGGFVGPQLPFVGPPKPGLMDKAKQLGSMAVDKTEQGLDKLGEMSLQSPRAYWAGTGGALGLGTGLLGGLAAGSAGQSALDADEYERLKRQLQQYGG